MKFQIVYLLIILAFSNCAITLTKIEEVGCTNTDYSFKITASSDGVVAASQTVTLTFSSPTSPTDSCTYEAITASTGGTLTLNCKITSASLASTDVIITKVAVGSDEATANPALTITKAICPLNTFTPASKSEGSCTDGVYSFTVTGKVKIATTGETTFTPTFSAPTNPTATCSLPTSPITDNGAVITCKITSALSNSAITLTGLKAKGFSDVAVSGDTSTIATGKTCSGKEEEKTDNTNNSNTNNDGSKFISLNGVLLSILLLLF